MLKRYSGAAFVAVIILFGIPRTDATSAGQASSQDMAGKISRIDQEKISIDGVSFSYEWKVNPDFAPIALANFSAGDQVLFQVNKQGRIIKIAPMSPAAPATAPAIPPRAPAATASPRSAPIKQQNGVWTN